jgi:uncharacterized membrane protein YedE/YeeE
MKTSSSGNFIPYILFGTLFGYFLSKARATDYDTIVDMFLFKDFQLWGVILTAICVIVLGLFLLRFGFRGLIGIILFVVALGLLCWKFDAWPLGTTVFLVVAGYLVLKTKGIPTLIDQAQDWKPLEWEPGRLIGAFLFGTGWALAGTCPGTSLAQIGEGKVVALFTVVGIFAGVWAYHKIKPVPSAEDDVC